VTDPYASTGVQEEPVRICSTGGQKESEWVIDPYARTGVQEEPVRTCSTGG
jgi:hypothetical protein